MISIQDGSALLIGLGIILGAVGGYFKLLNDVKRNQDALEDYKEQCEKDRTSIKDGRLVDDRAVWDKMTEIQNAMTTGFINIAEKIGELKGRTENKNDN